MPTLAEVQKIKAAMQKLPDVEPEERELSNQEAVSHMKDEITTLREKGYTWDAIAEFLVEQGIGIKPTTLKSYARRAAAGTSTARKPRARKRAASTVSKPAATTVEKAPAKKEEPKGTKSKESDARFEAREDTDEI